MKHPSENKLAGANHSSPPLTVPKQAGPFLMRYYVHDIAPNRHAIISETGRWCEVTSDELAKTQALDTTTRLHPSLAAKLEQTGILVTPANESAVVADYRTKLGHLFYGVSLHIINPTNRCNQTCAYCYANAVSEHAADQDMDAETARRVVDFIFESPAPTLTIEFTGGEPLLNFPVMQEIISYANQKMQQKKKPVHWRLVSNLTKMDDDIARFLKNNRVSEICTSLDGPKKLHDANRPLSDQPAGAYDRVTYWIDRLQRTHGFARPYLMPVVTKKTLEFDPLDLVDEYLALGMDDITPTVLRPTGKAEPNWKTVGYTVDEYLSWWKKLVETCIDKTRNGSFIAEQYSTLFYSKMQNVSTPTHTCFSKPCGAALMQASYKPDGSVFTCDEGKSYELFKLGSVRQSYKQIYTAPTALNMIQHTTGVHWFCADCKWNPYCNICTVSTYREQGSITPTLPFLSEHHLKFGQIEFTFNKQFTRDKEILDAWLTRAKPDTHACVQRPGKSG